MAILRRPTLLIILDGFGLNPSKLNNAVVLAKTPRLDEYFAKYGHTALDASGRSVGLPKGQMGNSEVGHLTLGCGSVIRQDLVRIDDAIEEGSFARNKALRAAAEKAKRAGRPLHLIGLVSDGGVHSHVRHLLALIKLAHEIGARPLLHMITDGRDTPPSSAKRYLPEIEQALSAAGGAIASVCGRYYAMDRDKRWDRTKLTWSMLVHGEGREAGSASEAIGSAYATGETDEFIKPVRLTAFEPMQDKDSAIFFNFRNDRPRQLTAALSQEQFDGFDRGDAGRPCVTCLTRYDSQFLTPIAFEQERPQTTLAEAVSNAGIKQFHCSETEKYAHVTFFFNGGREDPFPGEERKLIGSPKVATYDLCPEMSAEGVADAVIEAMESDQYGFLVTNFANGDMVGHTAVRDAVIKAVEYMDTQVGRVLDTAMERGYSVLLTADHGNCDEMVDPITGEPHTQHTTYPVPCLIIDEVYWRLATGANISAVAPTVLDLMGLAQPEMMTGSSLLIEELRVAS